MVLPDPDRGEERGTGLNSSSDRHQGHPKVPEEIWHQRLHQSFSGRQSDGFATQCHLTRQLFSGRPTPLPSPASQQKPQGDELSWNSQNRKQGSQYCRTPVTAGSLVWWMALWTHPEKLFVTSFGHLDGRGVAGMPLLRKPRVILHGPARTETARPTVTVGADYVTSVLCQHIHPGLPFMVPAAFMDAA